MEGRLGKAIHEVRDAISCMQEDRRLNCAKKRATKEYQQMLKIFGGTSGIEVTNEQIAEYLKLDLKSARAIRSHMHFNNPIWWPSLQSEFLQRLEMTQDLETPEGKTVAIELFIEAKEKRIEWYSLLNDPSNKKNKFAVEHDRLIRAHEAAINLLKL